MKTTTAILAALALAGAALWAVARDNQGDTADGVQSALAECESRLDQDMARIEQDATEVYAAVETMMASVPTTAQSAITATWTPLRVSEFRSDFDKWAGVAEHIIAVKVEAQSDWLEVREAREDIGLPAALADDGSPLGELRRCEFNSGYFLGTTGELLVDFHRLRGQLESLVEEYGVVPDDL